VQELEALSGKKRRARLDAIKEACQGFFRGRLLTDLRELTAAAMTGARIPANRYRIELDAADIDQQTVLFWYPAATAAGDDYVRSAVKIEGGAKSAIDPNISTAVKPYAADDRPNMDLAVGGVTTVEAHRTFWDKVVILHGLRRWFDHRGQLRHGGQRISRHYYDVFRLLQSPAGQASERACALTMLTERRQNGRHGQRLASGPLPMRNGSTCERGLPRATTTSCCSARSEKSR
jgi:hypothetical protein